MDRVCFNCLTENPGHQSLHCPEHQKYTRCYICKRVCNCPEDHYSLCPNRLIFVSQYIRQPNTARSATLVADFKVLSTAELFLMDGPNPINISTEFDPIQLDANHGLLIGSNKALKYYQWFPAVNRRCVINVMDGSNNVRFSARLMNDVLVINKKIRVRNTGVVELRDDEPPNQISQAEVILKVDSLSTLYAFSKNFSFEISQVGVRYLPPEWLALECPICYENMVDGEFKITPCLHMFCTVCILQTLGGNVRCRCPVCRAPVTEQGLRSIQFHN